MTFLSHFVSDWFINKVTLALQNELANSSVSIFRKNTKGLNSFMTFC